MDCARAKQVLTDRYAPDLLDAHELDDALSHCEECLDCAMFARALASLDAIPRPVAPDGAIERTLEAVRLEQEAEDAQADLEVSAAAPVDIDAVASAAEESTPSPIARLLGGQRFGVYAAAAAVFVVAVFGGVQLLTSGMETASDGDAAFESADQPMGSIIDEEAAAARDNEAGSAPSEEQDVAAERPAPPYVVYEGIVHVVGTEVERTIASDPVGDVMSAKDVEGVSPRSWFVYETDDGDLFMQGSTFGLYARLTAVTRPYTTTTYALTSSQPIDAYGQWPGLPPSIPEPTSNDGAPALIEAGTDTAGTPLYSRTGTSLSEGFAVAPGTSSQDPAAGNPNWTWWEPIDG